MELSSKLTLEMLGQPFLLEKRIELLMLLKSMDPFQKRQKLCR